jgi:hypothetical protein
LYVYLIDSSSTLVRLPKTPEKTTDQIDVAVG